MPTKLTAVALVVLSALALAACGNPKKKDQAATNDSTATPIQALQEIDYVRKDLLRVTNEVAEGSRGTAVEIAKETYVQHFEKVEKPLDKVDHELNEKLEEGLRDKLPKMIKSGKSKSAIGKFAQRLDTDLAAAQEQLKER